MKNIFLAKIRELGIRKIVFLSIFGLVALAYLATPLMALACPGAGDGGGNNNAGNNNAGNNNAGNNNDGNNNGNNNNNNNNNNGNNDNNNAGANKGVANNGNNTTKRARRQAAKVDSGISLTINSQNFSSNRIACVRILNFITKQPITFSEFQALSQLAQTQGKTFQVQAQLIGQNQSQVCNGQPKNQKVQPLATSLGTFSINTTSNSSQSFGELTIKTDNQLVTMTSDPTISKSNVINPTSIKIPLRFSDTDPLLQTPVNGSRR